MSARSLEQLRAELSEVDRQLLDLVARRNRLSLDIGRSKRTLGRGTRDFSREKVVLERARSQATELGLSGDLAEAIMVRLIEESLSVQEQDRVAKTGSGTGQKALVIGGSGKMGRWFVTFLSSQGYAVEVADPGMPLRGIPHHVDWRAITLDHDLIVVAAPLANTNEILHAMAADPPPGVIFDIGSLKSPLRSGLLALKAAGAKVASIHPMFGPGTSLLSGRHVLFVDLGVAEATRTVRALFDATMAEQADMSLDDHDRLIAFVLGLSHALNLAFNAALTASGEALPLLARISSTTFDAQLGVASKVASENPNLYFEIQALNDYGATSLDALAEAVDAIRGLVKDRDQEGFTEMMTQGRAYLMGRTPTAVRR